MNPQRSRPAATRVSLALVTAMLVVSTGWLSLRLIGDESSGSGDSLIQRPEDSVLVGSTYQKRGMVQINSGPVPMDPGVAQLCRSAEFQHTHNPHELFYANVYVSSNAVAAFKLGLTEFPVGTLVVKEKLSGPAGKKSTGLYTGMVKRQFGYNPDGGDWEWFVVYGAEGQRQVTARGRLESCLDCHNKHRKSGFITSRYQQPPDRRK